MSALGLIAIAAIIWLLGPFLAFGDHRVLASPLARATAILIVVLIWILIILTRRLLAKRSDRALLGRMAESETASETESDVGDAAEDERAILKKRFDEAIALLRAPAEKGKRKPNSLYELPWYIIIGPPGCGKTTALLQSGMDFPLADHLGLKPLSGVGGTRNCDWWITNEAVLIDTAGRYTTQDSDARVDSSAWIGFLELLRKYRRRRPINGALVAFSITDLISLDEAALKVHCRAMRKRLQELVEKIGINIPIYIIFTKLDLINGFVEFFDDLGREGREQVWGTTFPIASERRDHATLLASEFDLLLNRLNARMNWRLMAERDIRRRSLILGFPLQFSSLKDTLTRFIEEIFQESRFERAIMVRGVYFTSGTQEGTPIDRVIGSMAESYGVSTPPSVQPGQRGKSFFITNLLRRVIFAEREIAGSDRRAERIRAWIQRGAYAGVALVTVLAALAWANSFTENKSFTADLDARLAQYEELRQEPIESALAYEQILEQLNALRAILDHVNKVTRSPPLTMRLGLYQGNGISEATGDAYFRALNALLLPGLASQIEEQLAVSIDDPSYSYETLKLYLMLIEPSRLDPELLELWATDDWERRYPDNPRVPAQLKKHLEYLAANANAIEPAQPNRPLIARVREELTRKPLAELVYGRVKMAPEVREAAPLSLEDIAGRGADSVFNIDNIDPNDLEIPSLFTYRGFFRLFQVESLKIISAMKSEAWVYGNEDSPILAEQIDQLEESVLQLYIDEYISRWDRLLGLLNIKPINSVAEAASLTGALIRPDSPLKRVLDTLADNSDLTRLPKGTEPVAELAVEALRRQNYYLSRIVGSAQRDNLADTVDFPPKRVKMHFALLTALVDGSSGTTVLSQVNRLLTELYGLVAAIEPDSGLSENPFSHSASSKNDVFHKLRTEAARLPEPIRRWLREIAAGAQSVTLGDAGERINEIYRSSIEPVCASLTTNRYPFTSGASRELSVYDFAKLFGDQGVLDSFFSEYLSPYVETAVKPWRWRQTAKKNFKVADESLAQFERAYQIKEAFFPEGGKMPSVRFSLIPRQIDLLVQDFTIAFGGQQLIFDGLRPAPVDGTWPGPNISNRLTLSVTDLDGEKFEQSFNGQWAFFRRVNPSRLKPGTERFRVAFSVQGFRNTFDVQTFSTNNPFGLAALTAFKCPKTL